MNPNVANLRAYDSFNQAEFDAVVAKMKNQAAKPSGVVSLTLDGSVFSMSLYEDDVARIAARDFNKALFASANMTRGELLAIGEWY
jgi:hypothetical protein